MEAITNVSVPVVPLRNKGGAYVPGMQAKASAETMPLPKPQRQEGSIDKTLAQAEAKRLENLRQAANSFVLSDQRFTIFKDMTGQYITRFTSLRDGRVTYIPEPDMRSWLNRSASSVDTTISLDV